MGDIAMTAERKRAEAELEAASGVALEVPRHVRRDVRGTREGDRERAEVHPLGVLDAEHEREERVVLRLAVARDVVAERLEAFRLRADGARV